MTANQIKHEVKLQEWADKVKACRSSGLTVTQWCVEQGINKTTYYKWESQILSRTNGNLPGTTLDKNNFIELPAPASHTPCTMQAASLCMNGVTVDLYNEASQEFLRNLMAVMQSC